MPIEPPPAEPDRRDAFAACESGAAILEFAIALPLLLALFGGAVEIGRALLVRQTMIDAVVNGARMLARSPDPSCSPSCTPMAARAVAQTEETIATDARVPRAAVHAAPRWDRGADIVTMQASVAFQGPLLGLVGLKPLLTLTARHEERRIVD